jgi:hypothetical protein
MKIIQNLSQVLERDLRCEFLNNDGRLTMNETTNIMRLQKLTSKLFVITWANINTI